jgi:hypothetical protein
MVNLVNILVFIALTSGITLGGAILWYGVRLRRSLRNFEDIDASNSFTIEGNGSLTYLLGGLAYRYGACQFRLYENMFVFKYSIGFQVVTLRLTPGKSKT